MTTVDPVSIATKTNSFVVAYAFWCHSWVRATKPKAKCPTRSCR